MLFLDLYTLPNSTSGVDTIVVDTMETVPSLAPLILLFIFGVIWIGGMSRQIARTGSTDAAMWCTIASIMTLLATLIMSVSSGFIRIEWLAIVISITIISGVWLFLDRRTSEI